ncbi:hypothetical protein DAPPUDRAFT_331849 [Daphnia pulex]|uniref:Retrotransposon Copia-like N-terminal domain-containing protein n=1 Tax=Daphnia pulex TaxID=6669 RepID=E9HNM0_DAPPU|nr:hypothetical protein DAPPUDRAFT_331849 [Daphnia pulex]|eukprot:EFX66661.1 hypothetical protein DAPPUDRAFT_331849 [Daphnia pulex]
MATSPLKDVGHLTKFDGTNFTRWQQGLMLILEQHELLPIINGTEVKPSEIITDNTVKNAKAISNWCRKDCTVRNYIYATITDELRDTLCTSTLAADMYQRVRNQQLSLR